MNTAIPGYSVIKVNGEDLTIPTEEYYDGMEEELEHEKQWSAIQNNLKDSPKIQQQAVKR